MYFYLNIIALLAAVGVASPAPAAAASACTPVGISSASASVVKAAFSSSRLIPDQVPSIDPKVEVHASYNGKEVNLGNTFTTPETLTEPTVSFTAESSYDPSTTKYLFILVDPDAPGPNAPLLRSFVHIIKYNLQPSCITSQKPITFLPYAALTPLSLQAHRYTYLIYRQPPGFVIPPLQLGEATRGTFNLATFVKQGGLTLVGGNFMYEGLGTDAPAASSALCSAEKALATNTLLNPQAVSSVEAALATVGVGCNV